MRNSHYDEGMIKGYIYCIVCNITGERYYGSTIQRMKDRIKDHRKKKNNTASKQIIDRGDWKHEKIFECFVPNKSELLKLEQNFINNNDCINKAPAYLSYEDRVEKKQKSQKEWKEKNEEKLKDYKKKYYEEKKLILNQKFNCNCGGRFIKQHEQRHLLTKKHQKYIKNNFKMLGAVKNLLNVLKINNIQ